MPIKKINSAGGGEYITVLENPDEDGSMGYGSMSPDGSKIAYIYYPAATNDQIRICNIDGTDDHLVAEAGDSGVWTNVYWGALVLAVAVDGYDGLGSDRPSGHPIFPVTVFRFFTEDGDVPPSDIIPYLEWPFWTTGWNISNGHGALTQQDVANEAQTNDISYEQVTWSPSGRYLYFEAFHRHDSSNLGYEAIVRADINDLYGHNTEIIAHGQTSSPGPQIDLSWPALNAAGTKLCVTKRSPAGVYEYSLWLMDSDGSDETLLFANAAWATWHPDGTKLFAYATGGDYDWVTPLVIDATTGEATVVTTETGSYGALGFLGDGSGHTEAVDPVTQPTPITNKVWFFSDTDSLIHNMNPDGTGDTLVDPRSAPDHVWLGGFGANNRWAISPLGDYVYFVDTDHSFVTNVWRSWNNCSHYRVVWVSPAHITVAANNYNVSWDGTKVLISIGSNDAYALIGPNGEPFGPDIDTGIATENGYPYTALSGWLLNYSQSAMQCMDPSSHYALVRLPGTPIQYGMIDLYSAVISNWTIASFTPAVEGMIGPAWSSQDEISYRSGSTGEMVVVTGLTGSDPPLTEQARWSTGGTLNNINMWNPAGTELIVDDASGNIKRYTASGTLLNTLSIAPSWPIGWS